MKKLMLALALAGFFVSFAEAAARVTVATVIAVKQPGRQAEIFVIPQGPLQGVQMPRGGVGAQQFSETVLLELFGLEAPGNGKNGVVTPG